jgi:hypothetical protein
MRGLNQTGQLLGSWRGSQRLVEKGGQIGESLGRMGHAAGCHPLPLLVNDDHIMMVVSPVNAGIPHRSRCPPSNWSLTG